MKKIFIIIIVLIIFFISLCYKCQEDNTLIIGNTYDINGISNNYLNNNKIVKIIDNESNISDLMYTIENNNLYNNKPIKNYIIKANTIIISINENSTINNNNYSKQLFSIYKQIIIIIKEISKEKIILLIKLNNNNEYTKIFKNNIRNYCFSKEIVIIFS